MKNLLDFILITVLLKAVVAHWLGERILKSSDKIFHSSERNLAIWTHYLSRAGGKGHVAQSVLNCIEKECAIFKI